jgi:hypothetical protein
MNALAAWPDVATAFLRWSVMRAMSHKGYVLTRRRSP